MKIAICEDLSDDRQRLSQSVAGYCRDNFYNAAIMEYGSGEALLEVFAKEKFEIVFLDIYMKDLNGIDTARELRAIDPDCLLVFVTSSRDFALDGFALNALHYLIKPVDGQKIAEVFARARKIRHQLQKYIEVLSDRILVKIPVNSIQYVEVYDKACFIHKKEEKIKTYLSLDEVAQKLAADAFLRCHRSYLVNMRAIVSVEENDFLLQSGLRIPIRQSEKRAIKQLYMDFLFAAAREE